MRASADLSLKPPAPSSPRIVRSELPLLEAIVSGGQTGVDQAGLRAAVRLGIATGGYAPRGWKTQDGPSPHLGSTYGLVEHWSTDYPPRTASNVHAADATLRIAETFTSPGEICTMRAIVKCKRPSISICVLPTTGSAFAVNELSTQTHNPLRALVDFLIEREVRVLNVAGNSEKTSPGIGKAAENFIVRALSGAS